MSDFLDDAEPDEQAGAAFMRTIHELAGLPSPADVLSADEVAAWLRVDRKTVYDAAGRGEIPHRRLGKRLLFSRGAVLDWLSCKPASKER